LKGDEWCAISAIVSNCQLVSLEVVEKFSQGSSAYAVSLVKPQQTQLWFDDIKDRIDLSP